MWDIDSRGGCKQEVGSVQEHSVISTQFWREPKTVLKNIVYLKEKKKISSSCSTSHHTGHGGFPISKRHRQSQALWITSEILMWINILKDRNYTWWVHQVIKVKERQIMTVKHWALRVVYYKFLPTTWWLLFLSSSSPSSSASSSPLSSSLTAFQEGEQHI